MKTIAHLLDDPNIGGVTRGLMSHIEKLTDFSGRATVVNPLGVVPPRIDDDVAIIHYTPSWRKLPFLSLLRAQCNDKPIIFVEHSYTAAFERLHVPNVRRFRQMLKLTYRLCDLVVAVSDEQGRWLVKKGIVPRSKLAVIRSAADNSQLLDIAPPARTEGPLRLLAYGRYCEQKGFDVLIEAMRLLPTGAATLTLAGYGPDEAMLRERASDLASVEIRGLATDIKTLLAEFDAVVIPSRYEAFGQVAVEARMAARPVIASHVDGLIEQISDRCGLLVEPENAPALAGAIQQLAKINLAEMGAAGRASAIGHFEDHLRRWNVLLANAHRADFTPAELTLAA